MAQPRPRTETFAPGPDSTGDFRAALGRFGTGVTVVTCDSSEGPMGITANSFASVSLDPPLVLWSPGRFSRRFAHYAGAEHFAIHVMGNDQIELCRGFARAPDAFAGLDWRRSERGVPLIEGCLARFECRQVAQHEGGDHAIIVAEVLRVTHRAGAPLLFYDGKYGGFDAPE